MNRYEIGNLTDEKVFRLWTLLLQTTHLFNRYRENELKRYRLKRMEAAIIQTLLITNHPPTISELSRWLVREPHTIGSLVHRMQRKGLLKVEEHPKRKSAKIVKMTEKSREFAVNTIEMNSVRAILAYLPEEDRTNLRQYLRVLRNKLIDVMGMEKKYGKSYLPEKYALDSKK